MRLGSWASGACTITPGLPQGSALSPVLFNVYTVGITSNQLEGPGRTLSFADDGLAYRTGKDRQVIANSVQEELDRIGAWCEANKKSDSSLVLPQQSGSESPDARCLYHRPNNQKRGNTAQ